MERAQIPRPVEYACALTVRDGQVLLGLRAPPKRLAPNAWDVLGGHVEAGETAEKALVRELEEEAGIRPHNPRDWMTLVEEEPDGSCAVWRLFLVREWSPAEPHLANDEHVKLRWLGLDEAAKLTPLASEAYRPIFRELLA